MGLKKGDKLRLQFDENTKTIVMQPHVEPPEEVFIRAGTRLTSSILKKSEELDEAKARKLLKALGVR